ncbi:MAG: SH3 domain-containing protein [Chloroflexota bacterium]|nr:SH3 domain-containing protein [Chloroflexota bacterium]
MRPLLTLLVSLLLASLAYAQTSTFYTVDTNSVNVRSQPRRTADIIAQIPGNTAVTVVGETEGELYAQSSSWNIVRIDGERGYVHSSLLTTESPAVDLTATHSSAVCPSLRPVCTRLTCAQAYACLEVGYTRLDRDRDGIPCESICTSG